ncbi:MAG TPA: ATP-binding protein [Chitinophagaceae bacterium]|nr:ATP-binding protein [Chitinophagaceae bacterium]
MNLFSIQDEFVKNIIKDTIETYSGQWRIVHEAIQNSHDAIQLNDKIKRGFIDIDLYVGTNKIQVRDNGTGISIEKFKNVFLLGGSDKASETTKKILKGSQGVGIKATLFTSNNFHIETIFNSKTWSVTLKDCYKYLDQSFDGDVGEPTLKDTSNATGTLIEYTLNDYSVRDFITEIVEEHFEEVLFNEENLSSIELTPEQLLLILENYFRTKTYIGCVQCLLGTNGELKPIDVSLRIHLDSASLNDHRNNQIQSVSFLSDDTTHGKVYEIKFDGKYLDFFELHANLPKREQVDKLYNSFEDILNNPPAETIKKLLIQKFDKDQAKRLLYRYRRQSDGTFLLEPDLALLSKHSRVINILNGIYLLIGQRPYVSKYFQIATKQLLSVNGLPTNIVLSPPRGALSYLNNVHILIDVDTKLGFGKRNIAGRTMGMINHFFVDIWSMIRKVAPEIVGLREGKDPTDIQVWNKEEEYANYLHQDNFLKNLPFYWKTIPKEEQEVISIFFELLGRKVLTGYYPFRMGVNSTYDGLFYVDESGKDNIPSTFQARLLKTIEFKRNLSELSKNFEEESKFLADIDLAICWINDCSDDDQYSVTSLERDNIRPLPGATLRIRKGTQQCQVIVLKELLENL